MVMTMSERRRGEDGTEEASPEPYELPPEIIGEILIRLPAKSIGRFRCVSKLFRSLSSDQRFAKRHLDLTIRNDSSRKLLLVSSHNLYALDFGTVSEGARDLIAVELDYPLKDEIRVMIGQQNPKSNPVGIVGSFNGLVCISSGEGAMFLYNPTTRESKRLPKNAIPRRYVEEFRICGFGFDDLTDDYKVVDLVPDVDGVLNASVYSLKANSWRRILRDLKYRHWNVFNNSGVNLNGACHWGFRLDDYRRVVLAFDIKTEEFREMPLPEEAEYFPSPGLKRLVVGDLNGRLCVVNSCYTLSQDMWVMNEYGVASSWSKIQISLLYTAMKPLCSTNNKEEFLLTLDGKLVLYNFETTASWNLGIRGVELSNSFDASTYVESLLSPNSYGVENLLESALVKQVKDGARWSSDYVIYFGMTCMEKQVTFFGHL